MIYNSCCYFMGRYWWIVVELQERDDIIRWKHFARYWPFVRGIHQPLVDSAHKGQWRGALMLSLIYTWRNDWANSRDGGDLRRHRACYDDTVMFTTTRLGVTFYCPFSAFDQSSHRPKFVVIKTALHQNPVWKRRGKCCLSTKNLLNLYTR